MIKPPALAPLSLRWRLPLRHVPWILGLVLLEVVVQSRWIVPWVIGQTGWTPKLGSSDALLGNPGVRRPQEAWRLLPWFGVVSLVGCVGLNAFDVLKAALDQRQWSPAPTCSSRPWSWPGCP